MDPGFYQDLTGRLDGLLIVLEDRLNCDDAPVIHQFTGASHDALALEEIARTAAHRAIGSTVREHAGASRWPAWPCQPGRTRRRRRVSSCGSWRRMDNAHYEDLAGRLYGLVIRLSDRMPADSAGWVHHVTEVGEYELALEDLAAILAHGKTAITDQERADMLALGRRMTLRHDLAGVLGACPRAGEDHGPGSR